MPRIPFVPGFEALADDMMTLQNAGIVRYASEAQRDEDWPDPHNGAMCLIADPAKTFVEGIQVFLNSSRRWQWLFWRPGNGSTAEVVATRHTAVPQMSTAPRPYPRGTYIALADGTPNLYLVARHVEGTFTTQNVLAFLASSRYIEINGPDSPTAIHKISQRMHTGDRSLMWTMLTDAAGGALAYCVIMRWGTNNRPEFQVYGKVISDNTPANLVERLQDVEARLARAEAALKIVNAQPDSFYEWDTAQEPPPVPPDPPEANPEYQSED